MLPALGRIAVASASALIALGASTDQAQFQKKLGCPGGKQKKKG